MKTVDEMATMTLPDAAAMLSALRSVEDDRGMTDDLYARIIQNAGSEKVGPGVVMMLLIAIHGYMQGYPPQMFALVCGFVPKWVEALTEGHEAVRADALEHWRASFPQYAD